MNKQPKNLLATRIEKSFYDVKIKEITDLKEIRLMLVPLFVLTSLRKENYPENLERDFLINFIQKNYGNYTVDEIMLAFELAIKRELIPYMSKNDDVKHYQNFSPDYFSSIMFGYQKYKSHVIVKNNLKKRIDKPKSFYKPVSDSEWLEKNIFYKYEILRKTNNYTWKSISEPFFYERLESMGVIKLTNEEKLKIKKEVETKISVPRTKKHLKEITIKNECKRTAFREWIMNNHKNKIDIKKYFK